MSGEGAPIGSHCIRFRGLWKRSSNWFQLYPFQGPLEKQPQLVPAVAVAVLVFQDFWDPEACLSRESQEAHACDVPVPIGVSFSEAPGKGTLEGPVKKLFKKVLQGLGSSER